MRSDERPPSYAARRAGGPALASSSKSWSNCSASRAIRSSRASMLFSTSRIRLSPLPLSGRAIVEEVVQCVDGHGLQPAAKAALRIVNEAAHASGQAHEDVLRDVLGIRVLDVAALAPAIDLRPVAIDERAPGSVVAGVLPQLPQQSRTRPRKLIRNHIHYRRNDDFLTRILPFTRFSSNSALRAVRKSSS